MTCTAADMIAYLLYRYGPYDHMTPDQRARIDSLTVEAEADARAEQARSDGMVPAWMADA